MDLDVLLGRLGGGGAVEDEPDGWLVPCPAHGDRRPSLKVFDKGDHVTVTCRSHGCAFADILKAAGLRAADLRVATGRPPRPPTPAAPLGPAELAPLRMYLDTVTAAYPGSPAAEYAARRFGITPEVGASLGLGYDDGADQPLPWRTRRFARYPRLVVPFRAFDQVARGVQGRDLTGECDARWLGLANPDTGARWSPLAVFRLPDAYASTIVTEGPGDALTVVGAGYAAIAIRGAGLARHTDIAQTIVAGVTGSIYLAGDRDKAGEAFNAGLGAALVGLGAVVRVLALPEGVNDLADWREQRGDAFAAELHAAVAAAPEWRPATPPPVDEDGPPSDGTDLGNARYAARLLGEDVQYVPGLGFLAWRGHVWEPIHPDHELSIAHQVADHLTEWARGVPTDSDRGKAARRMAGRARGNAGMVGMLASLRAIGDIRVSASDLDAHPHLIAARNGLVDLRTGTRQDPDKRLLITRSLRWDYDPDAQCPQWEWFLANLFDFDPGLPAYIQRLIGYGITGETDPPIFVWFRGKGQNGKSVLLDTLDYVFSGITGHLSQGTITHTRGELSNGAKSELAQLVGARLVTLSETGQGVRLNEELLKALASGDAMPVKLMGRDTFTLRPQALLIMGSNYEPEIRGQDEGIWRRCRLVTMPYQYLSITDPRFDPTKHRVADGDLRDDLRAEAPGIVAWAVRGAAEWYSTGKGSLGEPDSVVRAVTDFRERSDVLQGFYPGVVAPEPGQSVLLKHVYRAFVSWAEDNMDGRPWLLKTLKHALEERGATIVRRSDGVRVLDHIVSLAADLD